MSKIQGKEPSPATPQADPTSSGDQDNPSFPPRAGGCAPDTGIWAGEAFLSTAVNLQSQALLAVQTGLQAPDAGAGAGTGTEVSGDPDALDPLSQNSLKSGSLRAP